MSVDSDVQQEMVESLTYRLDKLQDNLTGAADIHQVQHSVLRSGNDVTDTESSFYICN